MKPVALIADAIRDCSRRGGIVLDPFGGSGSTLIAAERTKRKARLIELDPHYCDTIVRRWQKMTGERAEDLLLGGTFDECAKVAVEPVPGGRYNGDAAVLPQGRDAAF